MKEYKSKILERLLEKVKNYKPKPIKSNSVEYQLGYMIGEYIVMKYLPILDVFGYTNNTIYTSIEDYKKYESLNDIWFNKHKENNNNSIEWNNLQEFSKELEIKYMPHILECYVPYIEVNNIVELKAGIRKSLWDCDICSYKIETDDDIVIETFENRHILDNSIIKLKLNIK